MNKLRHTNSLENHLLIATPTLTDPHFARAVVYVCEHDENGAMGIMVNKPLKMKLEDILQQLNIETANAEIKQLPVLMGGPLGPEQGFIIQPDRELTENTPSTKEEEFVVSASKETLEQIAKSTGPQQILISLGYSAWTAGQLEEEIVDNTWIIAPAFTEILFEVPLAKRWVTAATMIGIDFTHLSGEVGHA